MGYIYKDEATTGRATGYYSDLDDVISLQMGRFENTDGAHLMGVELELQREFGEKVKLDSNLSYTYTKDSMTNAQIAGAVNWLANVGLLYEPIPDVVLNTQYRYVGERNRGPTDTRGDLGGYQTFNISGNIYNLGVPGLSLRAGVRNIFKEDIRQPSPVGTYPGDFPRADERQWWVQLGYDFPISK